jgi:GNAT superfamily N-acetyltransferase
MQNALETRSDEALGVVTVDGSRALGWMKIAPAASVPKLYAQRLYARLPCFDGPRDCVMTIGCALVDPAERRTGVASELLSAAIALARRRGAASLEAFPRRAEGLRDDEAWTGPFSLFERAGFRVVNDFSPYPVMRLSLEP